MFPLPLNNFWMMKNSALTVTVSTVSVSHSYKSMSVNSVLQIYGS